MPRIAILAHRDRPLDHDSYFLGAMAKVWRETGNEVTVQTGTGPVPDVDLAVMHVDLSEMSGEYLASVKDCRRVINGRVGDISKRRISRNIVVRGDGYLGPVLVKTNRNHGGLPEAHLAGQRLSLRRLAFGVRRRLPWYLGSELPVHGYRLFDSPREVPAFVWHNRDLVVEKFLPERREGHYCLRTWVFFGDKEISSLSYANCPVIKSSDVVRRELVDVPDDLREIRRELGFDFGKFDYVIQDGRAVLFDANWTPTVGSFPEDHYMPQVRMLAEGIGAFL